MPWLIYNKCDYVLKNSHYFQPEMVTVCFFHRCLCSIFHSFHIIEFELEGPVPDRHGDGGVAAQARGSVTVNLELPVTVSATSSTVMPLLGGRQSGTAAGWARRCRPGPGLTPQ
jgi:hypothetical protein